MIDKRHCGILSLPVIVGALEFFVDVGGWITGIVIMVIAVIAAWFTRESFGKDLNFLEL